MCLVSGAPRLADPTGISHGGDAAKARSKAKRRERGEATEGERISERRRKRRRRQGSYDEVKRRGKRKQKSNAHMVSAKRSRQVEMKTAIELGAMTINRIVANGYEWRDGDYRTRRKEETGQRQRDPG